MKKQLSILFIVAFAIFNTANAQTFEITSKDNFKVKGYLDPEDLYYDYKVHSVFKNTSISTSLDSAFVWEKKILKMPEGWFGTVCDPVSCYDSKVSKATFKKFAGKTGLLDVGFMPQGIPGEALLELKVYPAEKPELARTFTYTFVIENLSAVGNASNYILTSKLFPNPANFNLNIDLQLKSNQNIRLEIRDLNGKQILASIMETGNSIVKSIDVTTLPQGIYQISYFANEVRIMTKSFVIQ